MESERPSTDRTGTIGIIGADHTGEAADVLCVPCCGFRNAMRKEPSPRSSSPSHQEPPLSSTRTGRFPFSYAPFGRALSPRAGFRSRSGSQNGPRSARPGSSGRRSRPRCAATHRCRKAASSSSASRRRSPSTVLAKTGGRPRTRTQISSMKPGRGHSGDTGAGRIPNVEVPRAGRSYP